MNKYSAGSLGRLPMRLSRPVPSAPASAPRSSLSSSKIWGVFTTHWSYCLTSYHFDRRIYAMIWNIHHKHSYEAILRCRDAPPVAPQPRRWSPDNVDVGSPGLNLGKLCLKSVESMMLLTIIKFLLTSVFFPLSNNINRIASQSGWLLLHGECKLQRAKPRPGALRLTP